VVLSMLDKKGFHLPMKSFSKAKKIFSINQLSK